MTSVLYKWGMETSASRRYYLEFGGSMLGYVLLVIVALTGLHAVGPGSGWRFPLALLPVVPALAAMAAFIRFLRTMDEMQRRIQFEAFGIAFASTALITFSYGFLENAGLPGISLIWVAPAMIAIWGIATAVVTRRFA